MITLCFLKSSFLFVSVECVLFLKENNASIHMNSSIQMKPGAFFIYAALGNHLSFSWAILFRRVRVDSLFFCFVYIFILIMMCMGGF